MSKTIIGISGGTASGKTYFAQYLSSKIGSNSLLISQDNFYLNPKKSDQGSIKQRKYNFDSPDKIDFNELKKVITSIKNNEKKIKIPQYDFSTSKRTGYISISGKPNIIILEGLYILYNTDIRKLLDLKIFIDTDNEIRFGRRLLRDLSERGANIKSEIPYYLNYAKPSYDDHIYPTKKYADIVVDGSKNFNLPIDIVSKFTNKPKTIFIRKTKKMLKYRNNSK